MTLTASCITGEPPKNVWAYSILIFATCRFKVGWIQDETHRSEESIDRDTSLTPKEKKYLKGIVKRSQGGQLLKHPSLNDYKALVEAYGKLGNKHVTVSRVETIY